MKFSILLWLSLIAASAAIDEIEEQVDSEEDFEENYEESEEEVDSAGENANPQQWAVLVAGSDGWYNYRHQADICHAYHILINRGIPAKNIIVMMKDDIAYNTMNPKPGVIINKPNGTDVYKGVKIDYKGADVTPKNFLNILLGNAEALKGVGTGRVLKSGKKDNVFINFSDHGATGLLAFPNEFLYAADLIATLKKMKTKNKYAKMLLFIEACEAGSMFDNLIPQNTKILASTASAFDESSWGYYCDYGAYPCLGDLYSINWMEHLDTSIPNKENLFDQYQLIRTLTNESHVNLYGDFKNGLTTSNRFIGPHNFESANAKVNLEDVKKHATAVPSREVPLHWMKRMAQNAKNPLEGLKFASLVSEVEKKRVDVDDIVEKIVQRTAGSNDNLLKTIIGAPMELNLDMFECYKNMNSLFSEKCISLIKNPYAFKHLYKFANICLMDSAVQERAISAIETLCHSHFMKITGAI